MRTCAICGRKAVGYDCAGRSLCWWCLVSDAEGNPDGDDLPAPRVARHAKPTELIWWVLLPVVLALAVGWLFGWVA